MSERHAREALKNAAKKLGYMHLTWNPDTGSVSIMTNLTPDEIEVVTWWMQRNPNETTTHDQH